MGIFVLLRLTVILMRQALVKQAFDDGELRQTIGLNSANSINISRLLAQVCYYFEAVAQLPKENVIMLWFLCQVVILVT